MTQRPTSHDPAVVRLAELWYHAEGFLDQFQSGESLPDPKPWIERALQSEHSGDCTKQPWSCLRCHAEDAVTNASWVLPRLQNFLAQETTSD